MILDYIGLKDIGGSLIALDGVEGVHNEEMVDIRVGPDTFRRGRVVQIEGKRAVVQVFSGTSGMSLQNTRTRFTGRPMELALSPEMLGRIFDGAGFPIDGLGPVYPEKKANINGSPMNPVAREYPRNFIETGISSIDVLMTLIRGQ